MNIKDFVYSWNLMFPLDHWFREKHKIIFNSSIHRQVLLADISFEHEEDFLFKQIEEEGITRNDYHINKGDWIKENVVDENLTEEEQFDRALNEFKEIDLSKYDE